MAILNVLVLVCVLYVVLLSVVAERRQPFVGRAAGARSC